MLSEIRDAIMQAVSVAEPPLRITLVSGVLAFHVVLLGTRGLDQHLEMLLSMLLLVAYPVTTLAMTLGVAGVAWLYITMGYNVVGKV